MPERRTFPDDRAVVPPPADDEGARDPLFNDLTHFETFFHKHYGALCEYVRGIVDRPDVAEELAQDAFVRLWERHTRAPVSMAVAYLYTTARNRAYSHLRHRRVVRGTAQKMALEAAEPRSETVTAEVHANDLAAAAERAIDELPDRRRLIFLLSRREGLTYAEIADALEITVSTVDTQMSRALKHLRSRLGPYLVLAVAVPSLLELVRRYLH